MEKKCEEICSFSKIEKLCGHLLKKSDKTTVIIINFYQNHIKIFNLIAIRANSFLFRDTFNALEYKG